MDLLIYLVGGIPFLGGTLNDLYNSTKMPTRYIYGILISKFTDDELNKPQDELCNVSDQLQKRLYAPFCNPSKISDDWMPGLYMMSCLLGYLSHDGPKSEKLLHASSALIRFPPLITCMYRLIERRDVTSRDIITICSTFYTYFDYMISSGQMQILQEAKIYEYSLRCCNIITHIKNIPESDPIQTVERDNDKEMKQVFENLCLPEVIYSYKGDFDQRNDFVSVLEFTPRAIEDANKSFISFTPIAPLSMRLVRGCAIVKGKEQTYLYVRQSSLKGSNGQNKVDIIDPKQGKNLTVDLDAFSKDHIDRSR